MAALSPEARATIRGSGATIAGYVRQYSGPDGIWHGDKCGCTDHRCIGYHHDGAQGCHCLRSLLDEYLDRCSLCGFATREDGMPFCRPCKASLPKVASHS